MSSGAVGMWTAEVRDNQSCKDSGREESLSGQAPYSVNEGSKQGLKLEAVDARK